MGGVTDPSENRIGKTEKYPSQMGKSIKPVVTVLSAAAVLTAAGCSGSSGTNVSTTCSQAFSTLEQESSAMYAAEFQGRTFSDREWNSVDAGPLRACSSADEWLAAGKDNPGSLGYTDAEDIDEMMLGVYCYGDDVADAPVCLDAAAQGIQAP